MARMPNVRKHKPDGHRGEVQLELDLTGAIGRTKVQVTGIAADGWFSRDLSPRAFAKARPQFDKVDPLFVQLVGPLA